jgi:hypothetical protein
MEAPKIDPEVAFYVGLTVVAGVFAYMVYEGLFGGSGAVSTAYHEVGAMADQAATNYGASTSTEQYGPQIEYDSARSAYATSIAFDIAGQGVNNIPGWPTLADWENGDGPAGFTYGSQNYPQAPPASVWASIASVF